MFGSGWEWIIIGAALFLLFGASRLPQLAKSLSQSRKAFKEGMREAEEEERLEESKRQQITTSASAPVTTAMTDEELSAEMRRRTEAKQS